MGGGVGSGRWRGEGLPVVVSVVLQSGSRTQAWSIEAAGVCSVCGATNGLSSGCVSVTVAGQELGSRSFSGKWRLGRGTASEGYVTGGSACEASVWETSSSLEAWWAGASVAAGGAGKGCLLL